ncbi:UNVERIFIED_CONTAM: protein SIEL [Sesamum calycinum]|uniref:Protein SIEL n=1 Tax=Sesamum calycinum TaxID=2727403 RepID=A0AAW2NW48_9LAMI
MEHRLLSVTDSALREDSNLSPRFAAAVLSLITNPFTSDSTLSSLLEALVLRLQNPKSNSDHQRVLSLLSALSHHHPRLRHRIAAAAHAFILLPSTPTPSLPHALSLLDPAHHFQPDPFSDETLFLSLCFWQCVKTRRWILRNLNKFRVRPSVLLTVLLGFTKDPYPCIREAALDGLVMLSNGIVVEDPSLVEGCYFRAVELLFDAEKSVRLLAVRAVSEWGHLLLALNGDKTQREWSDALFVQLCLMVRDTDAEIRVAAFNALGKIQTVSEDILQQTLSKKALAATKEKKYPGQYTAKLFNIPATAAAFTFVHGLEDEFYQVRRSACHALQMLTVLSTEFSGGAVHILMDMLNDDSVVVRFQALETLHHMAMHDHLKVEESHLHMFFGALPDNNALIRSAVRKVLQFTKLQKLAMFRSCINGLIKNLERYPQDEAEIFYVLYKIGRTHGKFVTSIIHEVSQELEPSFDGKLGFDKKRTAALLVLAISAPVSLERSICSIPPRIYSYAVTLLGRLSTGLVHVMDQNTLLAYLSHCSKFTVASTSENFEGELLNFDLKDGFSHLWKKSDASSFPESMELKKVTTPVHDYLLNSHIKATSCVEIVFRKVVDLWPLIQLQCMNEVVRTLRSWKEELRHFSCDPRHPAGVLGFALRYLHVIKLLGKAWTCYFSQRNLQFTETGVLEALLHKMESRLKEMLYRHAGLSRGEQLHILELMLVAYTLRLSCGGTSYFEDYINKLKNVLCRVEYLQKEGLVELSHFVIELQNISCEIGHSKDGFIYKLDRLEKSLNLFFLKHIVLSGELKYLDAEVDVCAYEFQDPLPFIPGLPVGMPFDITLYNISSETRLWLTISLGEKSAQFVFLDLSEFGGSNEIRSLTFLSPFFGAPKAKRFSLKASIAMECLSEDQHFKHCNGPKHELIHLCKEKEVHLSMPVK